MNENGEEATDENFWIYMACSAGQKYRDIKNSINPDKKILENLRRDALTYCEKAIKIKDFARVRLCFLWDKQKNPGVNENDLEVFYPDKDFEKLLSI